MQIINIHHPYDPEKLPQDDVVLALGFFDGVHRGHQEVINTAKKIANEKGLKLAVMTFNHHPAVVFQKIDHKKMKYITTIEQKEERMTRLGVDYLYVIEFTSSFAGLSPQEFVDEYMVGLHAKVVVAGFDYTYGKKDTANMSILPTYAKDRFEIVEVQKLSDREEKVSSTAIRECMKIGDMRAANQLLGYAYETTGVVVHGDKRGRLLGFPTANIKAPSYSLLPKVGVYVVKIKVTDKWYMGMAQIGYNITFETNRPMTIEVNILDFSDDIYGEQVSVEWLHFLRGEKKFDNVDGLIAQLKQDEQDTREYFDNLGGLV